MFIFIASLLIRARKWNHPRHPSLHDYTEEDYIQMLREKKNYQIFRKIVNLEKLSVMYSRPRQTDRQTAHVLILSHMRSLSCFLVCVFNVE